MGSKKRLQLLYTLNLRLFIIVSISIGLLYYSYEVLSYFWYRCFTFTFILSFTLISRHYVVEFPPKIKTLCLKSQNSTQRFVYYSEEKNINMSGDTTTEKRNMAVLRVPERPPTLPRGHKSSKSWLRNPHPSRYSQAKQANTITILTSPNYNNNVSSQDPVIVYVSWIKHAIRQNIPSQITIGAHKPLELCQNNQVTKRTNAYYIYLFHSFRSLLTEWPLSCWGLKLQKHFYYIFCLK